MMKLTRTIRKLVWITFRRAAWMRLGLLTLTASCVVAKPYVETSPRSVVVDDEVLVVVTHALLNNDERVPFDDYVDRLSDAMDAKEFEGLVGYSIRKVLFGDEVWTLTVWRDEAALRAFMQSGIHREAIAAAPSAVVSLRSRHFARAATQGPISWDEALATFAQLEAARAATR